MPIHRRRTVSLPVSIAVEYHLFSFDIGFERCSISIGCDRKRLGRLFISVTRNRYVLRRRFMLVNHNRNRSASCSRRLNRNRIDVRARSKHVTRRRNRLGRRIFERYVPSKPSGDSVEDARAAEEMVRTHASSEERAPVPSGLESVGRPRLDRRIRPRSYMLSTSSGAREGHRFVAHASPRYRRTIVVTNARAASAPSARSPVRMASSVPVANCCPA